MEEIKQLLKYRKYFLPGSLSCAYRRCGKTNCRCSSSKGHPVWLFAVVADGGRNVKSMPEEWNEQLKRRIRLGHQFQRAVNRLLQINVDLLVLWRNQRCDDKMEGWEDSYNDDLLPLPKLKKRPRTRKRN